MTPTPVFDTLLKRRSIRAYTDEPIERTQIEQILVGGMAAPSACNLQPWSFIVVDAPESLKELAQTTSSQFFGAPLVIVVCGETQHIPWPGEGWRQDCGAAVYGMMLAATELGLGSVCVGDFDTDVVRQLLAIPDHVAVVNLLVIGHPATERIPHSWYTEDAVHWQQYDADRPRTYRTLEMLRADADKGLI